KTRMEDFRRRMEAYLAKSQEDHLVSLWQDIQTGIKTYAIEHHIHIVLGYGDPCDKDLLDRFPNVNRKMQAMDLGNTIPFFAGRGTDISDPVVKWLNRWASEGNPKLTPPRPRF